MLSIKIFQLRKSILFNFSINSKINMKKLVTQFVLVVQRSFVDLNLYRVILNMRFLAFQQADHNILKICYSYIN